MGIIIIGYLRMKLLRLMVEVAQSTGTSLSFTTCVQVEGNNCNCNCRTSPVTIQLHNLTGTIFDNVNIVVRKVG